MPNALSETAYPRTKMHGNPRLPFGRDNRVWTCPSEVLERRSLGRTQGRQSGGPVSASHLLNQGKKQPSGRTMVRQSVLGSPMQSSAGARKPRTNSMVFRCSSCGGAHESRLGCRASAPEVGARSRGHGWAPGSGSTQASNDVGAQGSQINEV